VSVIEEAFNFESILKMFDDLPTAEYSDEDFETIEIELHQKCVFSRQCKLRTSRWWPFGTLGTDTIEASRIQAIEYLKGAEADWFLRKLAQTKSILKTYRELMFFDELDEPERERIEGYIWDSRDYDERFICPDHYDIDPELSEDEIAELIYDADHSDWFDLTEYLDRRPSDDGKTWLYGEGSDYDRVNQYHFMDYYVLLHGEKVRPQEKTYFSKAVKGFMVLNGPTHYIDKYTGGDVGESFIGRVLIGDRVLTEQQLVDMAQRYVEENSWNK